MTPAPLTDRAKHRLRLAAGLLRGRGVTFNCPRAEFYDAIQAAIAALAADQRDELRDLVDWLEEYDQADGTKRQSR